MPRPRKYVIRNGQQIDGVSEHVKWGYYIISGGKRQYFGKTDAGLGQAKAEHDRQSGGVPKTVPAITPDEAQAILDLLESAGVDTTKPHDAPKWANEMADSALAARKLNPEWARENPKRVVDYLVTDVFKVDPDKWERMKKRPATVNPDGQQITVSQVGKLYLTWYVTDKGVTRQDRVVFLLRPARCFLKTRTTGDQATEHLSTPSRASPKTSAPPGSPAGRAYMKSLSIDGETAQ